MAAIDIVIQDVVYDPVGRDVDGEYVIIANPGPEPVDMTGWTLNDTLQHRQRAPFTFKFPRFILAAGNLVRGHTGSGINDADDLYWGRRAAVWTNTGDTAVLSDERGREISRFTFDLGSPYIHTINLKGLPVHECGGIDPHIALYDGESGSGGIGVCGGVIFNLKLIGGGFTDTVQGWELFTPELDPGSGGGNSTARGFT